MILLSLVWLTLAACDADLFKTKDKGEDPVVSEIITDKLDLAVHAGDTVKCWISASDPEGGTLEYLWNCTAGDFLTTRDGDSIVWRAPLHGGEFNMQVQVSNKSNSVTRSKAIRVISSEKPVVNIISPQDGSFLVQFNSYTVTVEAFHDHGIYTVQIYVNDELLGNCNQIQPSLFRLDWTVATSSGLKELKSVAVANFTGAVSADSVLVSVEGVIPGKQ